MDIVSFLTDKEDIGEGILCRASESRIERSVIELGVFFETLVRVFRSTVDADARLLSLERRIEIVSSEEALAALFTAIYCSVRALGRLSAVRFSVEEQRIAICLSPESARPMDGVLTAMDKRVHNAVIDLARRTGICLSVTDRESVISIPLYRAVGASAYIASEDFLSLCVARTLRDISSLSDEKP